MKGYRIKWIVVAVLIQLVSVNNLISQKFWLTTNEFPGGPKTSISMSNDTCVLVGLTDGILGSCNEGKQFNRILNSSFIYSLFKTKAGKIFAGGKGKVFISIDQGLHWDSVSINSNYPVLQIVENQQNEFFAITGGLDNDQIINGDGVYYSNNDGLSWAKRNNGLGSATSCERIAIDKNGRLYLGIVDENIPTQSGLYISDNKGLLWEHINFLIDGKGSVPNQIRITNTFGLSISPSDSVYLSCSGIAVNVSVSLNTVKSINDIRNAGFWKVIHVTNLSSQFEDRCLNNMHFAKNGDWYSSAIGSINTGATFFSKNKGSSWRKIDFGLGLDLFGQRNIQYFAENKAGKIFMVQFFDERIYTADTSIVTATKIARLAVELDLYPNPIRSGGQLNIVSSHPFLEHHISIYDITGRLILSKKDSGRNMRVIVPYSTGMFYVRVHNKYRVVKKLLTVN